MKTREIIDYKHVVERLHTAAAPSDTSISAPKASRKKPSARGASQVASLLDELQSRSQARDGQASPATSVLQAQQDTLKALRDSLPQADLMHGVRPANISEKREIVGRIDALSRDLEAEKLASGAALPQDKQTLNLYAKLYKPEGGLTRAAKALSHGMTRRAALLRQTKTLASDGYKGLLPADGPKTTYALSCKNLQALTHELGALLPDEQSLFKRLTEGEMYFKHATDSFDLIRDSGRFISPDLGASNNGTSIKNVPFDHEGYVFGRLELQRGPMNSRFGGTTIEMPFDALPHATNIILRDQCQPLATLPKELREDPSNPKSEVVRTLSESAHDKYGWEATYRDNPAVGTKTGNIVDDLFVGRDTCRKALAAHVLVELRRMAGIDKDGAPQSPSGAGARFRANVLSNPDFLNKVFTKLVRPQILVPWELDMRINGRAANTLVYNAAGSGLFDQGASDEKVKLLNDSWNSQKKNINGSRPEVQGTFVNRLVDLEKHLNRLGVATGAAAVPKKKGGKTQGPKVAAGPMDVSLALTSFEVLCTWRGRLQELLAAKNLPDTKLRQDVSTKLRSMEDAIEQFSKSPKAQGLVVRYGNTFVVKRRFSRPAEVLTQEQAALSVTGHLWPGLPARRRNEPKLI